MKKKDMEHFVTTGKIDDAWQYDMMVTEGKANQDIVHLESWQMEIYDSQRYAAWPRMNE